MQKFYQTFKAELIQKHLKLFHKIEIEETLPSSFYEATVTMIFKLHKDSKKKENLRPVSPMKINANILDKILANRIQKHIENSIHYNQLGFFTVMQGCINIWKFINVIHHLSKLKKKKQPIGLSHYLVKKPVNDATQLHVKNLREINDTVCISKEIKVIYSNAISNYMERNLKKFH